MRASGISGILGPHLKTNTCLPILCSQMTAVGITENVKGDVKKFEIWYNAREEVYIIQVGPRSFWPGIRDSSSLFRITDERLLVRAGV